MNFQAIGAKQEMIQRIRISERIKELTYEVRVAYDELVCLRNAPWHDFRAMVRRMKLRAFIREMNAQIREYREQLGDMYKQQNDQNKWN